jgi:hypothetical protein
LGQGIVELASMSWMSGYGCRKGCRESSVWVGGWGWYYLEVSPASPAGLLVHDS